MLLYTYLWLAADATEPSVSDPSALGLDGCLIEDATEPSVSDPSPLGLCGQLLEDVTDSSPSLVLEDATGTAGSFPHS